MKSGEGVCEASDVLPTMEATVIAKNVDIEQLRDVMYDITMSVDFITYHTSKKLNRPSGTREQELAIVQSGEKGYLIK